MGITWNYEIRHLLDNFSFVLDFVSFRIAKEINIIDYKLVSISIPMSNGVKNEFYDSMLQGTNVSSDKARRPLIALTKPTIFVCLIVY